MKTTIVAIAGVGLLALAGCAGSSPKPVAEAADQRCFDVGQVRSLTPKTDTSLIVVTNGNAAYELHLASPCVDRDVQYRPQLLPHSGPNICGAGDADVRYPDGTGNMASNATCRVDSVRQLHGDEAAKAVSGM